MLRAVIRGRRVRRAGKVAQMVAERKWWQHLLSCTFKHGAMA